MSNMIPFNKITIKAVNKEGWPIDFEISPGETTTAQAIEYLERYGFRPAPTAEDSKTIQYTPDGLPICPKHGVPMRKREKQGDTWYSHSIEDSHGDPHYCRGYKSKNSPGWEL